MAIGLLLIGTTFVQVVLLSMENYLYYYEGEFFLLF